MESKQPDSPLQQNNKCASPSSKESTFIIYGNNGSGLIEQILVELGWKKLTDKSSDSFRLKWVENKSSVNYDTFKEGEQLVNRIPNCFLLTNKLGLLTSLQRYERVWTMLNLGRIVKLRTSDFIPETYRIDDSTERRIFLEIFKSNDIWICKPTGLNQGRGIFLVRNLEEFRKCVNEREELERKQQKPAIERVIQRYVTNPLLLDGKKFDIRVFMLVASTAPFLILFHKGYARLCLQMYNNQSDDLTGHLTNQFVQRRDATYEYFKEDTVWSIEKLNNYINKKVARLKGLEPDWVYNTLTNRMKQIMLYCFHAVKHKLKSRVGYFDLYGLDFLVDENMKVWLIEINANPCLATNCATLKEVIPSVVQESLYLAIECFEKSRRGLPLYPLQTLKNFQILFNGSHSSAYLHPNYPSLKRSWSLVSAGLRNFTSRDGQDKEYDKTAKDFSRNYMTSIVFESPDEHNYSSIPVSMFDLNQIENRKLLVYESNHTSSLPGSQKSLTSMTQITSPINYYFINGKQQEADKETGDFSRKRELSENLDKVQATVSPVRDRLPQDQTTSEKLNTDQTSEISIKDEVISEKSSKDHMLSEKSSRDQTTEKSDRDRPTSEKSNKDQTIQEYSNKVQVPDRSTKDQLISEKSAKKQTLHNSGKDQMTSNKLKGLIISDKFNRGHASWEKTISQMAHVDDQRTSESQSTRSLFDLSGFRSIMSLTKSKTNSEDSPPSVSAKLKAEELPSANLTMSASAKTAKQPPALPVKPQVQAVASARAKPEEASTSVAFSRNGSNINSFMKPIQFLSSNHSHHDKKSGPLDSIVEQLKKDEAQAKIQQATLRPNREYRLVNTDIFGNSISDNSMMRSYYYPVTNHEYAYNSLKSYDGNRAPEFSRFQYADRSKTLMSKIYPRINKHFLPTQENKSYLSPNVLSAYSFANAKNPIISSLDYAAYPSSDGKSSRVNQIKDLQNKKPLPSSEYTEVSSNRVSPVSLDKPSDRFMEVTVDKKSWELKGQMLFKETSKNALKEVMRSPTETTQNTYNPGAWNQGELGNSGTMLQDTRGSLSATKLLEGYKSRGTWNGALRVFPDPDVWLAGLHKTTGNQVTFSRPQNSADKDWGHFTVVSPK